MPRPSLLSKLPPLSVAAVKAGNLTEKQEAFCRLFASGTLGVKSAEVAGYADSHAAYYQLTQNPAVMSRVIQLRTKRIQGDMASLALTTLSDIMASPAYPAAARVSAAKTVLEMAGHGIVAQGQKLRYSLDNEGKSLNEMNASELEEFVKRQRAAIDAIEDVSRSVNAPVIELNHSESTVQTALLGQFISCDDGGDADVVGDAMTDPAASAAPTPAHPPKSHAPKP